MCGIGGIFTHTDSTPNQASLTSMGAQMYHRGPDDQGIFLAPHIGMVHRRLSIRDLTSAGRNPMSDPRGRVQIMLNGEIYNWRELRHELKNLGYPFKTRSDVEVLVNGYLAWGKKLFPRLRGMFAIAAWDSTTSTLFLIRDRIGEKPLFFHQDQSGLCFSSSIHALASILEHRKIDAAGIGCFLIHSFIPHEVTVWEHVRVLPPAHILRIQPDSTTLIERYWDFPRCPPGRGSFRSIPRHKAKVLDLLKDSVQRCLDADVPVGVFLSGGVDSSLIAALASEKHPGIPAFSLGFAEEQFSELPYAQKVAEKLDIPLHTMEITAEHVIEGLPHLISQYGQPFGDSSAIATYFVAKHARRHVTVCLSGDGGDEVFGGYWRLQAGVYASRFDRVVPRWIRKFIIPRLAQKTGRTGKRLLALNQLSLAPSGGGYTNNESWLNCYQAIAGSQLSDLMLEELVHHRVGKALNREEASTVQRILYDDFQVQLPDDYLTKVDVASMAASLEVRAPFLDRDVLEYAWRLPDRTKLCWGKRKYLLKQLAARYVPKDIIYRKKMGFALPMEPWFRGLLGEYLEALLRESRAEEQGWLRRGVAHQTLARHRRGENHHTRLWLVLWLELWLRFINGELNIPEVGVCHETATPHSHRSTP